MSGSTEMALSELSFLRRIASRLTVSCIYIVLRESCPSGTNNVNISTKYAWGGFAAAVSITTTMDATGFSMFSALPLFPLLCLFWYLQRFSRLEIGLVRGGVQDYLWAVAYPLTVLSTMILLAHSAGATDLAGADWSKAGINIILGSSVGIVVVLLTEEGFFRGWLWATLRRGGFSQTNTLLLTTVLFVAWHVSAIALNTGFDVPASEIPVYLLNATLIGLIFGMLRLVSGSVLVASVCHAVWNGIAYPFFGFGEKVGALGIQDTHLFGPEVGYAGLLFNSAFALVLWRVVCMRRPSCDNEGVTSPVGR